jgi:two-component system, chemotaxis family, CheB/CheR fusion protein
VDDERPQAAPRRRVLVADDDPDAAMTLAILLEAAGNDVRMASDGQAAIDLAAQFAPDVVLLDIGMPRMNGYDACRGIRALPSCRNAYLVALTGWGQDKDRHRAHEAGFDRHLVKPVEPRELDRLVREVPRKDAATPAA